MDGHVALVVDDDPDIALVCTLQLEAAGFTVLEAADGRSAVELARAELPSVILLDYMLPDFDGVEVMRRLDEHPETSDIPVVMLTARTHERDQRAAWKAGVTDFVTKPFDGDKLVQVVRSAAGLLVGDAPEVLSRRPARSSRGAVPSWGDDTWLAGVLHGAHDAIICKTLDGEITYWNRGAELLYGWHASEAVGRHVSILTSKETEAEIPDILRRVGRGETVEIFDTVRLHRNGSRLHVSLCVSPVLDEHGLVVGASAIARDVTAWVVAEQRHQQLLEQAPDALVVLDATGTIELVNRRAEMLFDRPREELLGRPLETFVPGGAWQALSRSSRSDSGSQGRPRPDDLSGLRADGSRFPVEVSVSPLDDGSGGHVATLRDVSGRRRREARFSGLLDAAPDALVAVDAEGFITLVNRRTEQVFGYPREQLVGRRIDLLIADRELSSVPRPDPPGPGEEMSLSAATPVEIMARRRDGSTFPVEVSMSTYRTDKGVTTVAAVRDVTARRRSEERFRAVVEAAPDAMVIVDEGGTIELVNAQMVRLFGYQRDELVGQQVEMLVPSRFRDRHVGHRRGFHESASLRPMGAGLELAGLRKDGSEFAIEISLSPLDQASGASLTCATIRDVSERRMVEEAKALAAEREREAAARLREIDRMRTDFLSTVSHELRTPLTAIKGFSEWLSNSWDVTEEDRKREMVRRIHQAGGRLDFLIQDLLDFSRLERGQLKVDIAPLSLRVHVQEALQHAASALEHHHVVKDVERALVLADRSTFMRVLENLLTNAAKFSPPGSTIEVFTRTDGERLTLSVRDHGVGIPEGEQEKIFDRFYRVPSTAQTTPGTGIGLAIVKQFMEAQGGTVSVHSPDDGGTEFRLELRRAST